MALISPTTLLSLHQASANQITALSSRPSRRYQYVDGANDGQATVIPARALFNGLPKDDPGPEALPTPSECAVHLEMLEVFHTLRHEVIQSHDLDVAFGIVPQPLTRYRKKWDGRKYVAERILIQDSRFEERRKLKWKRFLTIAATRFHQWIQMVEDCLDEADRGGPRPKHLLLPPVDVLVIWHAFLLNCDDFKNYCDMYKLAHIQDIVFPWAEIHAAIDSDTWKYTLKHEHIYWLRVNHGIDGNLVDSLATAGAVNGPFRRLLSWFDKRQWAVSKTDEPHSLLQTLKTASNMKKENVSIVENVERQCIFVDKMHAHRWIRSPAVDGTLRRAVDRYDKFLHLFRLHPDQFLVPTLDVDLTWHTHQCSAQKYRTFVTDRVGRFINHDDKIGRGTLDNGFTHAEQWYRLRFGEQYQVCLCWSCEATLSAVEELDEEILDKAEPDIDDLVRSVEGRVHYYRELETARRLGRLLPIWNHR